MHGQRNFESGEENKITHSVMTTRRDLDLNPAFICDICFESEYLCVDKWSLQEINNKLSHFSPDIDWFMLY